MIEDAGQYKVSAVNKAGHSELIVEVIVIDHAKVKTRSTTKLLNESDSLSIQCVASGIPAPVISWSKYIPPYLAFGPEPPSTSLPYNHTLISSNPVADNNGVYTVSSVLLVPSVRYTDRGTYICTAANDEDDSSIDMSSTAFPVIVQTPPTITSHLAVITGLVNTSINMGVVIERDNPAVIPSAIHWTYNNQIIAPSAHNSFSEDNRSLTIGLLGYHDDGQYTVTAFNDAGAITTVITLTVLDPVQVRSTQSQAIVNQSSNISLTCTGRGRPLPSITWTRESGGPGGAGAQGVERNLLPLAKRIVNEVISEGDLYQQYIQSSLTLYNVSEHENGSIFICTGSNNISGSNINGSYNITEYTATNAVNIQLIVQVAPVVDVVGSDEMILIQYRDSNLPLEAILMFSLDGGVPYNFEFHFSSFRTTKDDIQLELNNSSKYMMEWDAGGKTVTVRIANIDYTDEGLYTLHARNNAGVTSSSIRLQIKVEAAVTASGPVVIQAVQHSSVTFSCIADGVPRPSSVVWFRNMTLIDTQLFQRINITEIAVDGFRHPSYGGLKSVLTIEDVNPNTDTALYTCRTGNGVGQPAILGQPHNLRISKAPLTNLCNRLQPCANGGICFDTELSYYCLCTFDYSGENCDEAIKSEIPPAIVNPPQNTTSALYSTVTLSCNATGTPTPRITWYKDGIPVSDDQSNFNEFIIDELSLSSRGFYHCQATSRINNEIIQITSGVAVVNIIGVVQYRAHLEVQDSSSANSSLLDIESVQSLIEEVNEFVAGSIIKGDSSLFFIELQNITNTDLSSNGYIPIVITIINSEGGSDELLQAVQTGLSHLNIGIKTNVSFLVTDRHDGCQSDVTIIPSFPPNPSLEIRIEWPEINIGEEAIVSCPCGGANLGDTATFKARRYCGGMFTEGAQWMEGFVAPCNFTNRVREICSIAQLPPSDRIARIRTITEIDLDSTELVVATSVLLTTRENAIGDRNLTESFFDVVDNFQAMPTGVVRESVNHGNVSARLLEAFEILSESIDLPTNEPSESIAFDTFTITIQSLLHGLGDDDSATKKEEDEVSYQDFSGIDFNSVSLPQDLIDAVSDNSTPPNLVLASNFASSALFLPRSVNHEHNSFVVSSEIFSVSLSQRKVENLMNPVKIFIKPNKTMEMGRPFRCSYWDPALDDGFGGWSQNGCKSTYTENTGLLACHCDHLTNFAVLLDASPEEVPPDDSIVGQALTAISYIGVILSIFCLLVIIVTYLLSRKLRHTEHGKLLLSFCFALLGLYISFILALHGTDVPAVCAIISVILQYFLLVTFFVMASEAINLYMKLVIVLGKGISRYFLKATLVAWVTPIFIIIFCFAPNYKFYIGNHFCRVHNIPFYVGIIAPFIIVYIFNWILFAIIMFKLIKKRFKTRYHESVSKNQQMTNKQQFMIALTLSLLFGLGWGVGLLATQGLYTVTAIREMFSAFFILLTAFQGLFLFLMHCVKSKEVRKQWLIWAYKATGKEVPSSFFTSSTGFSRNSTLRKQTSTIRSTFARSATIKESTNKTGEFDTDDFVTSHQMERFDNSNNNSNNKDVVADIDYDIPSNTNTPLDVRSIVNYPLPTGMTLDEASAPDFHGSQCSIGSTTSGGIHNYYCNPTEAKLNIHYRTSLYSISETTSTMLTQITSSSSCTNLPNPLMEDSEQKLGILNDV